MPANSATESFYQVAASLCNVNLVTSVTDVVPMYNCSLLFQFVTFVWCGHMSMAYFCG